MDMSFALQALAVEHLVRARRELAPGVHPVPEAIDREVARAQARLARRARSTALSRRAGALPARLA